jgi:hypothetical protein
MIGDTHYLGDGAYVRWDQFGVLVLFTTDGVRITNQIFLEPEVLDALQAYLAQTSAAKGGQ